MYLISKKYQFKKMQYDFSEEEFDELLNKYTRQCSDIYQGTISKKDVLNKNPNYFTNCDQNYGTDDSDDSEYNEMNEIEETIRQVEIVMKLKSDENSIERIDMVQKPYKMSFYDENTNKSKYQLIVIQENKTNSSQELTTSDCSTEKKKRGRPKGSTKKTKSIIISDSSNTTINEKFTYLEINKLSLKMLLEIGKKNNIKGITGKKKSDIIEKFVENGIVIS